MSDITGFAGLVTSQGTDDSVIICGTDPNLSGSMIRDDYGRARNTFMPSGVMGSMKIPEAFPEFRAIDNSGDHEGGSYTIVAMNKFNVDAACGGINMNSNGNITLNAGGGILNLVSESLVEIHGEVIKADSNGMVRFTGPILDLANEEINCINRTTFHSNAIVEGGVFVKGELYTTHITGQREEWWTEECDPQSTYFNPNLVLSGECVIKQIAPPSPDGNIKDGATCQLVFTLNEPTTTTAMGFTKEHDHMFYHIAADLKADAQEVWSDAQNIVNSEAKPAKAKTNFSNRLDTLVSRRVRSASTLVSNKIGI
jgi:hypothetical protein